VSVPVVVATGLVLGGFLAFAVDRVVKARRGPVRTGFEELVGAAGEVRTPLEPEGHVFVEGALWRARLGGQGSALGLGDRVRVEAVEGLTLLVRPETAAESEEGAS